jgi:ubiquinone/menaquinone biosynthesis C-methylase UbiE
MGFSFESVDATDYDELRPTYAQEAVRWVAERGRWEPGSLVVDLAAGTGQLARRLTPLGVRVIAVEPARNMRAVLQTNLPSVTVEAGTAERIPLGDGTADAVVVGNAFHHFDADAAFAEIRRVLRVDGSLGLFWAWPMEEQHLIYPGLREIDEIVERTRGASSIATAYRSWAQLPAPADGFSAFERREFSRVHELPSSRLADLYATSSDIASLPPASRVELIDRIREIARGLPADLELPARSVVDLCSRT